MLHQRRLDLERGDPDAAHLQHVVAAAGVGVVAVGVAHVLVAALGPAALEGLARLLAVAPVHQGRARALDVEVADLAVGDRAAVLAAQLDLVALDRLAGGAVAHVAEPVGEEHVQHLGRADAVDDRRAEVALEALADLRRQRLAGGRAHAQRHRLARRQAGRGEHAGEAGRRAEEHRRTDRGAAGGGRGGAGPALEHGVGRRPLGHQQDGRADREREGQRIAEAVREIELGGGEADVGFGQAEHGLAVELGGPPGVGMGVHRALGLAGRARRIEPERGVVAAGRGGLGQRLVRGEERTEGDRAGGQRARRRRRRSGA